MILYLVRHGETDWNHALRFQGREDIPLNETGAAQALACGQALRAAGLRAVYTSPLQRAFVTGQILAQQAGLPLTAVRALPALIERDLGPYSGRSFSDRGTFFSLAGGETPGMEPFETVRRRMRAALAEIAASGLPAAAAVSHGAAINVLLADLTDGAQGTGKTKLWNGGITVLAGGAEGFRLAACNLTPAEFEARAAEFG